MNQKIIEAAAEAAHEVNRIYCAALGDISQPAWKDAPDWQKESARKGVAGALAGNTPEQSHEGWLAEKAATGWKYGPVKDSARKEHPCMVPYADLPPEQRAKDTLFLGTVRGMAAALGACVSYPATSTTPARTLDWSTSPPRVVSIDGPTPVGAHEVVTGKGHRADANGTCG